MSFERETKVRQWMLATVWDGGIQRLDDLHVDHIDESWKEPTSWFSAGLIAYGIALRIRDELGIDVAVALAFSLLDAQDTSPDVFETQEEFEKQFDWSPPSLYLFDVGDQQHLAATIRVDPLPKALFSHFPEDTKSFLLRWLADNGNQRRSVIIQAKLTETVSVKGAGLQRVQLTPANWFAPPDGNRSRLFLSNEKHSFLGNFPPGSREGASSFAGVGEGKGLVPTATALCYHSRPIRRSPLRSLRARSPVRLRCTIQRISSRRRFMMGVVAAGVSASGFQAAGTASDWKHSRLRPCL